MKHPAVLKAAAFPIYDERLGERVCLGIIARDGTEVDAPQMLEHLNEQGLSKYDMPEYFICMKTFPLTASGKILKRELIEQVKAGKIKPAAVRWMSPEKHKA